MSKQKLIKITVELIMDVEDTSEGFMNDAVSMLFTENLMREDIIMDWQYSNKPPQYIGEFQDYKEGDAFSAGADKKKEIRSMLRDIWKTVGMDIPSNEDEIVEFCYEDVNAAADPDCWHSGDVAIAFRRWVEFKAEKHS